VRARKACLRWAAAAALVLLASAASAEARISGDEFLRRLDDARALAEEGMDGVASERMDAVRATLGLPLTVVFPGWTVTVPEDPLLASLDGDSPQDFERAARHLDTLLREAERVRSAHVVEQSRLGAALAGAYEGLQSAEPSFLGRVRRAIADFFASVLDRLFRFSGLGTIVAWLAIGAVTALIAWIVVRLRLVPERIRPPAGWREAETLRDRDWLRLAEDAIRRADLLESVRLLYRALLATLARRGVVADTPTVTAGECRDAVRRARPDIYPAVAEATSAFERVVYGRAAPDRRDVESLRRAEVQARAR
jgi:hypothetical protein